MLARCLILALTLAYLRVMDLDPNRTTGLRRTEAPDRDRDTIEITAPCMLDLPLICLTKACRDRSTGSRLGAVHEYR